MIKIIPAEEAREISSCGPMSCKHYGRTADTGAPICWKKPQRFSVTEMMIDGFPEWCPLETKPAGDKGQG